MISAVNVGPVPTLDGRSARGWRRAFGWSATSAPVALLLLTGIALGPDGINLLSSSVLPLLNPVVPVALAALGVLVGLGAGDRKPAERRLLAAALLEATVALVVVGLGLGILGWTNAAGAVLPFWTLPVVCGISAATSLTLPAGNSLEPRSPPTRVTEAGVLVPIAVGGLVLAWLRAGAPAASLALLAQASAVTLALAAAGWLLLTRTSSVTEERVFAVSVLLLVGGAADALGQSALLGGLIAGVFWRWAGGRPRDSIGRDVLFVQHPLLVLVLLVAGARAELSWLSAVLGLAYVVLRVVGTLAGSFVATRVAEKPLLPGDLGRRLLRPGVFGVAFALNAASVASGDTSILLATIVVGTVGSELAALLLPPGSDSE